MTQPAKGQEPSMEEILASIRRIIADDEPANETTESRQENVARESAAQAPPRPSAAPSHAAPMSPPPRIAAAADAQVLARRESAGDGRAAGARRDRTRVARTRLTIDDAGDGQATLCRLRSAVGSPPSSAAGVFPRTRKPRPAARRRSR